MAQNTVTLRRGSKEKALVMRLQDSLKKLGYGKYLGDSGPNHDGIDGDFGSKTVTAVKEFQQDHQIEDDGIAGPVTQNHLNEALAKLNQPVTPPAPKPTVPQYLSKATHPYLTTQQIAEINEALQSVGQVRREMCVEGLKYVWERGLYIWGGNLFNKERKLNIVDSDYIRRKIEGTEYDDARGRMMIKQADKMKAAGDFVVGTDCSGQEVGLLRYLQLVSGSFDCTADSFYRHYCTKISKADLKPGDFVFKASLLKIPHMGMYVGNGWVLEAAGGAYGVQLTRLDDRRLKSQVTGGTSKSYNFGYFGRPKLKGYEN